MPSFKSILLRTDVTAVKILPNLILIGTGGYLQVFERSSLKLLKKWTIFPDKKIFYILPNAKCNKLALFGETQVKIFLVKEEFELEETCKVDNFDWILTAKWICNESQIAMLSMNNTLYIRDCTNLYLLSKKRCSERCILYGGDIFELEERIIVFGGTVFTQVLIWATSSLNHEDEDSCSVITSLNNHKGVIFHIDYHPKSQLLCSTSDDRTAIVWKVEDSLISPKITKKYQFSNHVSRIFRCKFLNDFLITAGEDSTINIWNCLFGELFRNIQINKGSPIWSLDCDETTKEILVGSGNGEAVLIPLNTSSNQIKEIILPKKLSPRALKFLGNNDLVITTESGGLFKTCNNNLKLIAHHKDLQEYCLLEVSSCGSYCSLSGFKGQIYFYQLLNDDLKLLFKFEMFSKTRIYSFHWITDKVFIVCQNEGVLTLFFIQENTIKQKAKFVLPKYKDNWSTSACLTKNLNIVIGNRKGHLNVFKIGLKNPVQTILKVHNHLGITKLIYKNNKVFCLGRTGTIKIFSCLENSLELLTCDKIGINWLTNMSEDSNNFFGFVGNNFVVWDAIYRRTLIEISCGGGHRSNDYKMDHFQSLFAFIKDKVVNLIKLNKNEFSPLNIIQGTHCKEINSVKYINLKSETLVVSGGEDTTLRLSLVKNNKFKEMLTLKSHLSSIRTLTLFEIDCENILVVSGGGRAQVVTWLLNVNTKTISLQHSHYDKEVNVEARIMDLSVVKLNFKILLFCGCSDGNIQVFEVIFKNQKYEIKFFTSINYGPKCILKISMLKIALKTFLITTTTDGFLTFWDVTEIRKNTKIKYNKKFKIHQSGINSLSYKQIDQKQLLVLSGGDDNAINFNLFIYDEENDMFSLKNSFQDCFTHCAQITGVKILENFFVTSSIDQRVTLFQWNLLNKKLKVELKKLFISSVADIQGMQCWDEGKLCKILVHGQGIELIEAVYNDNK